MTILKNELRIHFGNVLKFFNEDLPSEAC